MIRACAPLPTATIATTEATPIMMPSAVRLERSLLRRNARRAIIAVSNERSTKFSNRGKHGQASRAFCSAWSSVARSSRACARFSFRRVTDDLPVAHDDDAFAIGGDVQFVRDHDDGDAGVVEFLEQPHDFDARAGVEIAGRLVGQHQFRLVHQRAGNGDALLLSAGKLAGMMPAGRRGPLSPTLAAAR